jgi:hypothetical protein
MEWAVLEVPPKAIHYFSNLPFGWVPKNDLEFTQLFMQTWREDWMNFCRDARSALSRLVCIFIRFLLSMSRALSGTTLTS